MLALRLPTEIEERLEALAKATGRTKSFYAREAILAHLDDLEDIYLAKKALEDPRQLGKPLTGQLSELWRYRVGDYRLIASIEDAEIRILVVRIAHRSKVYR